MLENCDVYPLTNNNLSAKEHVIIFSLFVLLTLIVFNTPILDLDKIIIANGPESKFFVWNLWHFKNAVLNLKNPFITNYIYFPVGGNILLNDAPILNAALSLPINWLFNSAAALNFITLLGFILAGYGAFLLSYYFNKNKFASTIAGFIYSFGPSHFASLGTLSVNGIHWIPLFMLFCIKAFKELKTRDFFLSSLFLVLIALTSWYYFMFSSVFIGLFITYNLLFKWNKVFNKEFIIKFSMMVCLFLLIISPLLIPMLLRSLSSSGRDFIGAVWFSNDVLDFFTRTESYVGMPILALIIGSFFIKFKSKRFLLSMAAAFITLSMGPILKINGILMLKANLGLGRLFQFFEPNMKSIGSDILSSYIGVPLPGLILYFLPFFSMMRGLSRSFIFGWLFISIIVGITLTYLYQKLRRVKIKKISFGTALFTLVILLLLIDFYPSMKMESFDYEVDEFYYFMGQDKETYGIIEVPTPFRAMGDYHFNQIFHKKPLINGILSQGEGDSFSFIESDPFIYWLLFPKRSDVNMTEPIIKEGLNKLEENNFRYIIIHKIFKENIVKKKDPRLIKLGEKDPKLKQIIDNYYDQFGEEEPADYINIIEPILKQQKLDYIYENQDIKVYKI